MLASPTLLPLLLPLLIVIACLWFALLRVNPKCAAWSTIGVFVAFMGYMTYLTESWQSAAIAGLVLVYMATIYKQINQGCDCLQGGLGALGESPMALPIICLNAF